MYGCYIVAKIGKQCCDRNPVAKLSNSTPLLASSKLATANAGYKITVTDNHFSTVSSLTASSIPSISPPTFRTTDGNADTVLAYIVITISDTSPPQPSHPYLSDWSKQLFYLIAEFKLELLLYMHMCFFWESIRRYNDHTRNLRMQTINSFSTHSLNLTVTHFVIKISSFDENSNSQ